MVSRLVLTEIIHYKETYTKKTERHKKVHSPQECFEVGYFWLETPTILKIKSHPFYPIIWAGFEQEQCLEKFTNSWPSSSNLHSNELFFPLFHFLHWDGQKWISKNITNSWLSASNLQKFFSFNFSWPQ